MFVFIFHKAVGGGLKSSLNNGVKGGRMVPTDQ